MQTYFNGGVTLVVFFLGLFLQRLFKALDDANERHEELERELHQFQLHVPETYVSRDTLKDLVVSRLDRLERKIDKLLSANGTDE